MARWMPSSVRRNALRNTPSVTIIEQPEGTAIRLSRHVVRNGLLAVLLGVSLGVLIAFAIEFFAKERRAHPDAFGELQRLRPRLPRRRALGA